MLANKNEWAEVHCMVCDKSFAVKWEYLEEDGCFLKAGVEHPLFCPYCRAEALYAGESVIDEDLENYGYEAYDDDDDDDCDEDGCMNREQYEKYAKGA